MLIQEDGADNMTQIRYYELAYDDIAQISRLETEFFSTPWSEASIAHYAEAGNTIFVVARSEEPYIAGKPDVSGDALPDSTMPVKTDESAFPRQVVGYMAILCAADEGNLVSIGVHKDYREMGIARELLDIGYGLASGRGVASINLEVRKSNEPAIRLYESEGFTCVGTRKNFYRNPTEDALLYIKNL